MTRTGAAARPALDFDDRADSLLAWAQIHMRQLSIGAIVIVVVALGVWFYMHAQAVREESASSALSTAEQAYAAGNAALAQSDLDKMITRYSGTHAAREGAMLLAHVLYQKGQYAQGIAKLSALTASDDPAIASGAENLQAAGYEAMRKFDEAAQHYQHAAATTPYTAYRSTYRASAARALMEAGKTSEAAALWKTLASDKDPGIAAEARVRLGQLEAKPVSKG
ncbi:MAG TPA: tetratricopeptide repeat protein [Gemmatimonadaceae bacterium]|nr:tetratricopeptide repeat protein [Gemmatimonadaceae bacterium]